MALFANLTHKIECQLFFVNKFLVCLATNSIKSKPSEAIVEVTCPGICVNFPFIGILIGHKHFMDYYSAVTYCTSLHTSSLLVSEKINGLGNFCFFMR